jgi:hypothetical protein
LSVKAMGYAKELTVCPDGAELTAPLKLLVMILADCHNADREAAFPALPKLASFRLASIAQVKRDLNYLEDHCLIRQVHPKVSGRGHGCKYVFMELDAPAELEAALMARQKGVVGEPLFRAAANSRVNGKGVVDEPFFCPAETGSEGVHEWVHPERETGSQGVHLAQRNKEELRTLEQKQTQNITLATVNRVAANSPEASAALNVWLEVKSELRERLGKEGWKWLRPMYLLKVMGGRCLLLAIPANGEIIAGAQANKRLIQEALDRRGYSLAGLTRYPNAHELQRIRQESPEYYGQMIGVTKGVHGEAQ